MTKLEWVAHDKYGWYYLKRFPFFSSYIKRTEINNRIFYSYAYDNYATLEQAKIAVVSNLRKACKEVLNTPEKGLFILISNNHLYNNSLNMSVYQYGNNTYIKGNYYHCSDTIMFRNFNIDTIIKKSIKILIRHCNRFLNQTL